MGMTARDLARAIYQTQIIRGIHRETLHFPSSPIAAFCDNVLDLPVS